MTARPETYAESINSMEKTLGEMAKGQLQLKEMIQTTTDPALRAEMVTHLAAGLDQMDDMQKLLVETKFHQKIMPMMEEAGAALGTGDQTTTDDTMKWHAARGNEFAQAYFEHQDSFEVKQRASEMDAALDWHPAWHRVNEHEWGTKSDDPEDLDDAKILASYRRHISASKSAPWT